MANYNYDEIGISTTTSFVGIDSSITYQFSPLGSYVISTSNGSATFSAYQFNILNVTIDALIQSTLYQIQSTSSYNITESIGGVSTLYVPDNVSYYGTPPLTLNILNSTISGITTSTLYQIQSTSSFSVEESIGGVSTLYVPDNVSYYGTPPLTLNILNSTMSGYSFDRRPKTGQLYPRSYSISPDVTSGIINVGIATTSGPSSIRSKTRSGYLIGKRGNSGQLLPRGTRLNY